jgi:hypothetical protein
LLPDQIQCFTVYLSFRTKLHGINNHPRANEKRADQETLLRNRFPAALAALADYSQTATTERTQYYTYPQPEQRGCGQKEPYFALNFPGNADGGAK